MTLWTKPEQDRDFMRAGKENRVMTVIQHNVGTKKDFGLVGFFPKDKAALLVEGTKSGAFFSNSAGHWNLIYE